MLRIIMSFKRLKGLESMETCYIICIIIVQSMWNVYIAFDVNIQWKLNDVYMHSLYHVDVLHSN